MYKLHIANKNYSSWSLRPWVLLKQLEIPFEEQLHRFEPDRDGRSFNSFSPTGKLPLLVDGDTVVWDSLAIVEYLAEHHKTVWPAGAVARAWARSAAAEMHSGFAALRNVCGMNVGVRVKLNGIPEPLAKDLARLNELWRDGLARFGGPFLAGDSFTAADAFFAPVAYRIQTYGLPLSDEAKAYATRLLALPAMEDWTTAALAEDFRDHPHDAELRQHGEVTADLRAPEKG
jgi:glutathione S-transferase